MGETTSEDSIDFAIIAWADFTSSEFERQTELVNFVTRL